MFFKEVSFAKTSSISNVRIEKEYASKIIALIFGCLLLIGSSFLEMPLESELQKASGKLLTLNYVNKVRGGYYEIRLEGNGLTFRPSTAGCDNVLDKLEKLVGSSIDITYSPVYLFNQDIPIFYKVYDIWSEKKLICTYFELSQFRKRDNSLGVYAGLAIILISLFKIIRQKYSNPSFKRDA